MTARDVAGFFDRYAHDFDAIYAGRRRGYQRATDRLLRHSMFARAILKRKRCRKNI